MDILKIYKFYIQILLNRKNFVNLWALSVLGSLFIIGYFFVGQISSTNLLFLAWVILFIVCQSLGYGLYPLLFYQDQDNFIYGLHPYVTTVNLAKLLAFSTYLFIFMLLFFGVIGLVSFISLKIWIKNILILPFVSLYIASYVIICHCLSGQINRFTSHLLLPFFIAPFAICLYYQESLWNNQMAWACIGMLGGLALFSICLMLMVEVFKKRAL